MKCIVWDTLHYVAPPLRRSAAPLREFRVFSVFFMRRRRRRCHTTSFEVLQSLASSLLLLSRGARTLEYN